MFIRVHILRMKTENKQKYTSRKPRKQKMKKIHYKTTQIFRNSTYVDSKKKRKRKKIHQKIKKTSFSKLNIQISNKTENKENKTEKNTTHTR